MARPLLKPLHKRTKIVCTIGPASASLGVLKQMIEAGMDVARINFSHGSYDSNLLLLDRVRQASKQVGRHIAIMQDLQGPRIRVGQLPPDGLLLLEGKMAELQAGVLTAEPGVIPVPYDRLARDIGAGDRILLDDGTKELEVIRIRGNRITAKVLLGGQLLSHKGINVPTVSLSTEAITEKDEHDLAFGLKENVDFIALSFVRSADDVKKLQATIKRHLPKDMSSPAVVVKIEKHEALHNFAEILAHTDGVMIARGDLGLETPVSRLPMQQKEIIRQCLLAGKPVITATEMLSSMERRPRPTRAEVSDVANAVLDHTDAVMLSGETAMGHHPVRAVDMMAQIIRATEESSLDEITEQEVREGDSVEQTMGAAAVRLADQVSAQLILVTTESGYSARAITRFRPSVPIVAITANRRTSQQLLLSWGVQSLFMPQAQEPQTMIRQALKELQGPYKLKKGQVAIVVSGLKRDRGGYDSAIRVMEL